LAVLICGAGSFFDGAFASGPAALLLRLRVRPCEFFAGGYSSLLVYIELVLSAVPTVFIFPVFVFEHTPPRGSA